MSFMGQPLSARIYERVVLYSGTSLVMHWSRVRLFDIDNNGKIQINDFSKFKDVKNEVFFFSQFPKSSCSLKIYS